MRDLVLADRYQARERLGSGAGAGVEEYLGRDLRLARPVVIQVIRGAGKDGVAPRARLMASLDHPAVASVYDWGQQGDLAYLIREYVPGQDLGRLLIERGVLPAAQAAAVAAEVAAALAAAHRIGLAHGSLDAADVILGDQRVTVVGFGAAWMREAGMPAATADPSPSGVPGGTAGPVPPGGTAGPAPPGGAGGPGGRDPDPQADLRALGGMLYQMVTGASPEQWPVVTPMAGAGLPMPLRRVIERLMAPEPGNRYQAAEAVRADLLHLTHEQAATVQPAGQAQPAGHAQPAAPADALPRRVPASKAGPRSGAKAGRPIGGRLRGQVPRRRRRGRGRAGVWIGVILGLALLSGAIGAALVLARDPGDRATVRTPTGPGPTSATTVRAARLPDVVGLDEQAAVTRLERDGFVANISRQPSDQEAGVVTSQSPPPGSGRRWARPSSSRSPAGRRAGSPRRHCRPPWRRHPTAFTRNAAPRSAACGRPCAPGRRRRTRPPPRSRRTPAPRTSR